MAGGEGEKGRRRVGSKIQNKKEEIEITLRIFEKVISKHFISLIKHITTHICIYNLMFIYI